MSIPVWMAPGSTIKRWLAVFTLGMLIVLLGIDYLLVDLYHKGSFPSWAAPETKALTLQWIPRGVRGVLFLVAGLATILFSLHRLDKVIVALIPKGNSRVGPQRNSVIGAVAQHKFLQRGPRIVAVGGGTGMSLLLHGLRAYSRNLTVVVTVADDGGSSGRLRRELRILPPGDFRQCIAALADVEDLMVELLQYRFKKGSGLEGHSFGNLFIAAMADITGSFEQALAATSRVLAVRGDILPSTLTDVTLAAELYDQSKIEGESAVGKGASPISRVFLVPEAPAANPDAVAKILDADILVVGPGSLYTSIMPNLLVPGIAQAIEESKASLKVFVCNVATEPGETDDYSVRDFISAIDRHVGRRLFDVIITNINYRAEKPGAWKSQVVHPDPSTKHVGAAVIERDVVDSYNALRHDPQKLSQVLLELFDGKRRTPERPTGRRVS